MEFKRPDCRIKLCWTIYTLGVALIPFGASVVLFRLPSLPPWVPQLFTFLWISALIALLSVYYPLRYRHIRYALSEDAVISERGLVFTIHRHMPLCAVRHITVLRGPIERMTGLTTILISATGGYLLLEGLPTDEADKLTQALL